MTEQQEMNVTEKEIFRHCTVDEINTIKASGPLSDDSFIRAKQVAYRDLCKASGVIIPDTVGALTHYPV